MIRLAGIKDFWVLKRLRIIGIVDSNNFWLFKMTNLFLEATFLVDIWWITGLSKYYLFVEGYDQGIRGEVLGCLGILGNNHVYDCVVDRDSRGGSIMRCLVAKAVRTIKREGFVPKLDLSLIHI